MRKLVLASTIIALVASIAVGCKPAGSGSARLEGKWKGTKAEGVVGPPEVQAKADIFAQGTEILAHGNQITIKTPAGPPVSATYAVDKDEPATVVIHTDKDGTIETFTFNPPGDTMTWKVDAQKSIVFRKGP
jgi:hypothetical protein